MKNTALALAILAIICLIANSDLVNVNSASSLTITTQPSMSTTNQPSPITTQIPKQAFYRILITSPVADQTYINKVALNFYLEKMQNRVGNLTVATDILVYNPEENEIEFKWNKTQSWDSTPNRIDYTIPLENLTEGVYRAIISANTTIFSKSSYGTIISEVSESGAQTGNFGISKNPQDSTSLVISEFTIPIIAIIIVIGILLLVLKSVKKK